MVFLCGLFQTNIIVFGNELSLNPTILDYYYSVFTINHGITVDPWYLCIYGSKESAIEEKVTNAQGA
jgi:hypothetical protein